MNILTTGLAVLALSLPAWACSGTPPTITDLQLPSSAVVGDVAEVTVTVSDPDGLNGLEMEAKLIVDGKSAISAVAVTAPDSITESPVTVFLIFGVPGEFTVEITAIDGDDERSNTLSGRVPVSSN